jgi:SAM-dependent methyltransferase
MCCPACGADLDLSAEALVCAGGGHRFPIEKELPLLFAPNDWSDARGDVTEAMKAFYEETPFPDYEEFDSLASLVEKARRGRFARLLDEQLPPGIRVLECGCGTGQLSSFLSVANREVFAADMCVNSLRLGQQFKRENELTRVHFFQMNLFRPAFRPGSFDLVVSNGVLHHTSEPRLAFEAISRLVKPGGHLLVGLYHRYGRLVTDLRRVVFGVSRDRFTFLDPNLREGAFESGSGRWRAWFRDQYKNPHESKHTIGEVIGWLREIGFEFVSSVPHPKPFQPFLDSDRLFEPEASGSRLERWLAELGTLRGGSREGGFFVVIGRRPPDRDRPVLSPGDRSS